MNPRILLVVVLMLTTVWCAGQARTRKMPGNINHSSLNNYAPYISLDGNSLAYISDAAEDNNLTLTYTVRDGVNWRDPLVLPKPVNNKLNFLKGFALSADGKTLFISNMKSNGIGGFDIYTSQLTGAFWSEPVNISIPINSKAHEACPSLSVDGTVLFFMRCDKMDFNRAEGCKIMMARKKPNGIWGEPVELPSSINRGNSQAPRIMGDDETLIFSTDKIQPNRGGMDLYVTRLVNGQWAAPKPLDFVNTAGDDQFVSATTAGRYLLVDTKGAHTQELVEILFPAEVRPKGTMKIEGKVQGPEPAATFVTLFNLQDQSKVTSTRPAADGTFIVYAREGGRYDLSVDPEKDNFTFFSRVYDLTGDKFPMIEKPEVHIGPASSGDEISLDGISFEPYSSKLSAASAQELRRLTRLVQGNPGHSFSVMVTLMGQLSDSVRSSPDLTEEKIDSVRIPVTYQIDSLNQGTRDSVVVKRTFHNDRTLQQARVIADYLIGQGIQARRIATSGKAMPEAILEERKTLVSVIIH